MGRKLCCALAVAIGSALSGCAVQEVPTDPYEEWTGIDAIYAVEGLSFDVESGADGFDLTAINTGGVDLCIDEAMWPRDAIFADLFLVRLRSGAFARYVGPIVNLVGQGEEFKLPAGSKSTVRVDLMSAYTWTQSDPVVEVQFHAPFYSCTSARIGDRPL
ncbi:hypothetical protein GVN24_34685 [Rhizobium sp. CRIBSB]|nr:hypothetical protein [Rhizobium sp. CRIBSB]